MKRHSEALYWKTNKEWYVSNYEKDCYELTELAPPRAVKSFKLYKKQNRRNVFKKFFLRLGKR